MLLKGDLNISLRTLDSENKGINGFIWALINLIFNENNVLGYCAHYLLKRYKHSLENSYKNSSVNKKNAKLV